MSLADDPRRFQRGYYRRVEVAMVIAAAAHAAVLWLAPPYVPRPYKLASPALRLVTAAIVGGEQAESDPLAIPVPASEPSWAARSDPSSVISEQLRVTPQARAGSGGVDAAGADLGEGGPSVFYAFDSPPRLTRRVQPEYPPMAREAGAQGAVVVNANVDEHGRVIRAWVAQASASEILIESALDAVYQFQFIPGSEHGIPVKCTVAIPINFSLK